MTVKSFKLISGEDVIGSVKNTTDSYYTLEAPATIIMQPSAEGRVNMAIMPFMAYTGDNDVVIFKHAIAAEADPDQQVINEYNRIFGSGIVVPTNKPFKL